MNFHAKGSAFERKFAKELSLWWTEGADAFVLSRRSASGGAGRDKSGHSGQSGDIQADKPVGELFLRFVSIELKSYNTLSSEMWKWLTGMGTGNTLIDRFWFQCCEDGEVTGRSPVLVLKANNRQSLVICSSGCVLYMIAYERWKAQAMQNGLDRKLALPLGYSKGLSAEFTQAHGQAILDLVDGAFSFEVSGLSDKDAFDVWFVDNRPGPRHSVKPEPGDGLVKLGRLDHGQGMGRLEVRLDRQALKGFKLDLLVVARADKHPGEGGLLFGSPDLFQRLFYNEKAGLAAQLGDALHRPEDQDPVSAPLRFSVPSAVQANEPVDPAALAALIIEGEDLFFNETFAGNGRTCGTCHPKNNNFTIDAAFIAKLPVNDPLFVAEFNSDLACNDGNPPSSQDSDGCPFEKPKLMRRSGLILENVDGVDDSPDLEDKFVMRSVPHTLALPTSLRPQSDFSKRENTGWSGDGAPGGGSLRDFATGAVFQHFTKTLNRVNKIDFGLRTRRELNALEAFQRSLGRSGDPNLNTLVLTSANATVGQIIFRDGKAGQSSCAACHFNAGAANSDAENGNFNTNVEDITDDKGKLAGIPRDGGFGTTGTNGHCTIPAPSSDCGFGDGEFTTPPVIEAADTGPFFHNNAVNTIEEAVLFYNGPEFNTRARLDDGGGYS